MFLAPSGIQGELVSRIDSILNIYPLPETLLVYVQDADRSLVRVPTSLIFVSKGSTVINDTGYSPVLSKAWALADTSIDADFSVHNLLLKSNITKNDSTQNRTLQVNAHLSTHNEHKNLKSAIIQEKTLIDADTSIDEISAPIKKSIDMDLCLDEVGENDFEFFHSPPKVNTERVMDIGSANTLANQFSPLHYSSNDPTPNADTSTPIITPSPLKTYEESPQFSPLTGGSPIGFSPRTPAVPNSPSKLHTSNSVYPQDELKPFQVEAVVMNVFRGPLEHPDLWNLAIPFSWRPFSFNTNAVLGEKQCLYGENGKWHYIPSHLLSPEPENTSQHFQIEDSSEMDSDSSILQEEFLIANLNVADLAKYCNRGTMKGANPMSKYFGCTWNLADDSDSMKLALSIAADQIYEIQKHYKNKPSGSSSDCHSFENISEIFKILCKLFEEGAEPKILSLVEYFELKGKFPSTQMTPRNLTQHMET